MPSDPDLEAILAMHGVSESDLLGSGGEARVYALPDDEVLRVLHPGTPVQLLFDRDDLVDELTAGDLPFAMAGMESVGAFEDRYFTVEPRLPGETVLERLRTAEGADRVALVESLLGAAAAIGSLPFEPRPYFGELLGTEPMRAATWRAFLQQRAARSLAIAGPDFAHLDAADLAEALPDSEERRFVHLDVFGGNVLAVGTEVTALLDIGGCCLAGDPRLDPLTAAVYLGAPEITPTARPEDLEVARAWLHANDLDQWFTATRRWAAAFWSFAVDDANLHRWCRRVLLEE